jgi:hypothetical protein
VATAGLLWVYDRLVRRDPLRGADARGTLAEENSA